jgi:hypothetical protein
MASTLVALQTVTVGAGGSSTITFSSIPQTYTDLVIKISARNNDTTGAGNILLGINGSTTNYSNIFIQGNGSGASSNSVAQMVGDMDTNAETANTFNNIDVYIPNYTSSNYKSFASDSVMENNATTAYQMLTANLWANTSAITSITLTNRTGGKSFLQYSTFTLYGVYKDAAETTPAAPTIGTATAGSQAADVAFTPAGSGAPASSYVVTSSPGGLTATGASSPIQIGGLTSGTAYTFTVRGQNPGGLGAASAASNSVTPYDGYESIATVNVGAGGTSSISFTSIPSTYTHLQIRGILRANTGGGSNTGGLVLQFNSDTGANYTSNHVLYGTGSSALAAATGTSMASGSVVNYPQSAATTNAYGVMVADILDYANTNKYKTVRGLGGYDGNDTNGIVTFRSFAWMNTSAITSITVGVSNDFAQYSTFELFGIRG